MSNWGIFAKSLWAPSLSIHYLSTYFFEYKTIDKYIHICIHEKRKIGDIGGTRPIEELYGNMECSAQFTYMWAKSFYSIFFKKCFQMLKHLMARPNILAIYVYDVVYGSTQLHAKDGYMLYYIYVGTSNISQHGWKVCLHLRNDRPLVSRVGSK